MVKKIDEKKRMVIEINEKEYPLRFGIKFLQEIQSTEEGLIMAVAGLLDDDAREIFRLLQAATNTYSELTEEKLEEYFEFEADVEGLTKDFLQILQVMNTTKKAVKRSLPRLKKLKEQQTQLQELTMEEMMTEVKNAELRVKQNR